MPDKSKLFDVNPMSNSAFTDEVDLLEYVARILQAKYRLVAISVFVALVTLGVTFLMPNLYTATALVAFNRYDQPGGIKPKDYRGSDTVALLERDMVIDTSPANEQERILARMRSHDFLSSYVESRNLRPIIFSHEWDEGSKKWKTNDEESVSVRAAVKIFNEKMLGDKIDDKSGLMNISITVGDPALAAKLANDFVQEFKRYQRQIVLNELNQRRDYLEQRLKNTNNMEFQRSIYRMLETQLSAEALINVRNNYPLEVILPALPPLLKSSPKRLLFAVVSFVATLFLGVAYLVGRVMYEKAVVQLQKYSVQPGSRPSALAARVPVATTEGISPLPKRPDLVADDKGDRWVEPSS